MAAGPIRIAVLADTKDVQKSLGQAEAAMDSAAATAKTAGSKIDSAFDSTAGHADDVASKGSQAAGALSGLGSLVGGKFGAAMVAGGTAMQAFADAGDLVNVITESAIVRKIKDTAVTIGQTTATIAKTVADKAAAAASKAWAAAQWLLNAALDANPIGLLVIAVAGLVAGIVIAYKKSETFRSIVNGAFNAVRNVVEKVLPAVKKVITTIFDGIKAYFKTVFAVYKTVFTAAWRVIKTVTTGAFQGIKNVIVKPIGDVVDFIKDVPAKITALGSKFASAGAAIMGRLIDGVKNAAGFIGNIAGSIWNALKSFINTQLIDRLNSFLEFTIHGPGPLPDVHVNPPDIQHLARGGITAGPTIAMIGDNPGGREAVIPLDKYDLGSKQMLGVLRSILAALTGGESVDYDRLADVLAARPMQVTQQIGQRQIATLYIEGRRASERLA